MIGCAAADHLNRGHTSPLTLGVQSRLAITDVMQAVSTLRVITSVNNVQRGKCIFNSSSRQPPQRYSNKQEELFCPFLPWKNTRPCA